jgi:ribosome-associated protein
MESFKLKEKNIHLNQLLKLLGWCENGGHANLVIDSGEVKVNGVVEFRKRNKIIPGYKVEFNGQLVVIE